MSGPAETVGGPAPDSEPAPAPEPASAPQPAAVAPAPAPAGPEPQQAAPAAAPGTLQERQAQARAFVATARDELPPAEYAEFVSQLKDIRAFCQDPRVDEAALSALLRSVAALLGAPERRHLRVAFTQFVPEAHRPLYVDIITPAPAPAPAAVPAPAALKKRRPASARPRARPQSAERPQAAARRRPQSAGRQPAGKKKGRRARPQSASASSVAAAAEHPEDEHEPRITQTQVTRPQSARVAGVTVPMPAPVAAARRPQSAAPRRRKRRPASGKPRTGGVVDRLVDSVMQSRTGRRRPRTAGARPGDGGVYEPTERRVQFDEQQNQQAQHGPESSLGRQVVAGRCSSPGFRFGGASREGAYAQWMVDFESGDAVRSHYENGSVRAAESVPSASRYDVRGMTRTGQVHSPAVGLPRATREARARMFMSAEHAQAENHAAGTPGPGTYAQAHAHGRQALSHKRSNPRFSFAAGRQPTGRGERLKKEEEPVNAYMVDERRGWHDSPLVHRGSPEQRFSRAPRKSAFVDRRSLPLTDISEDILRGMESPGPSAYASADPNKPKGFVVTFSTSKLGRDSYIPPHCREPRAGSFRAITERSAEERRRRHGSQRTGRVPTAFGKQLKGGTGPSFSFGSSKRTHFAESVVYNPESGIRNSRSRGAVAQKWLDRS